MILDCNERKGEVDMFDQNIEDFFCRRKTVRWPLLFLQHAICWSKQCIYTNAER